MDSAEVRDRLALLAAKLNELGVTSLSLFGSSAKGRARAESDLDFLVEFAGQATFDRYMGLKELLEREFDRDVDLVTVRALKPLLRDQIIREAIKVA